MKSCTWEERLKLCIFLGMPREEVEIALGLERNSKGELVKIEKIHWFKRLLGKVFRN